MSYIRRVGRYYPYVSNRVYISDIISLLDYQAWTPSGTIEIAGYVYTSCDVDIHDLEIKTDQDNERPSTLGVSSIVNFIQED